MASFKDGSRVTGNLRVDGTILDLNGETGTSGQVLSAVQTGDNEVKITTSDGAVDDLFGRSVEIGSNKIVIGSSSDNNTNGIDAGAVYVYDLDGTNETKITASDGAGSDQFGYSVAVGHNKIVVGAIGDDDNGSASGSVYVYDLDGSNEVKITASDGAASDTFGAEVAIGHNKIVVGANGDASSRGAAYVYNLDGTGETKITASDGGNGDIFGISVAIGSNKIVVGAAQDASNAGAAYVYDLDGTNEIKITASDGAANDYFGYSVAVGSGKILISADGDASSRGAAYVYDLDGTNETKITASDGASNDIFGISVAMGNNKLIVGASTEDGPLNSGSAYIYDLDGTNEVKIKASDAQSSDFFGVSVAAGESKIVVGAYGDDDNGSQSGSAYVYDLAGTDWVTATGGGSGTGITNYIKCVGTDTVSIGSAAPVGTWISPSWINTTPVFSNGTWTVSTTSITVPNTGVYLVNVNIELSTPDTNGRYSPEVAITVNGTRVEYRAAHSYMRGSSGHQESSSNQSTILNLSASNTVGIEWRPTCTGRGNIINMEETSSFIEIVQIV